MLADYRYVRRRVCVREHTINACCYWSKARRPGGRGTAEQAYVLW